MTPDAPTSWPAPAVPDLQPGLPTRATDPKKLTRRCFRRLHCRLPFFWFQRQFFDFLRFLALNNAKKRTVDLLKTSTFSVFNLTSSFGFIRFFRFFCCAISVFFQPISVFFRTIFVFFQTIFVFFRTIFVFFRTIFVFFRTIFAFFRFYPSSLPLFFFAQFLFFFAQFSLFFARFSLFFVLLFYAVVPSSFLDAKIW